MAKKPSPNGPKPGPKPKIIDWDQVEQLSAIHCRPEEIAAFLNVSRDTLESRPEFSEVYAKGRDKGKSSIRRMQFAAAMKGNITMLIYLGKVVCGQVETNRTEVVTPNGIQVQASSVASVLSDPAVARCAGDLAIALALQSSGNGNSAQPGPLDPSPAPTNPE